MTPCSLFRVEVSQVGKVAGCVEEEVERNWSWRIITLDEEEEIVWTGGCEG
jgi:hypothetical protein